MAWRSTGWGMRDGSPPNGNPRYVFLEKDRKMPPCWGTTKVWKTQTQATHVLISHQTEAERGEGSLALRGRETVGFLLQDVATGRAALGTPGQAHPSGLPHPDSLLVHPVPRKRPGGLSQEASVPSGEWGEIWPQRPYLEAAACRAANN